MSVVRRQEVPRGLLRIEDCLGPDGGIVLPPGVTLVSLIDRNIAAVGNSVAYRYLDYTGAGDVRAVELTWVELGIRVRSIGAHVQRVASHGDRVAILAPQGLDFIAGFFAAVKAGSIAVPLFAPELPGHAERLEIALRDAQPAAVLTTAAAHDVVRSFVTRLSGLHTPDIIVIDEVPESAADAFVQNDPDIDDVSHLQYTSGATRPPVGVEITHRAAGFNLLQMILSIDLLDRNTHGVSWLPLYHDMGLSMIGFPAVYGGHSTLMSPTAFVRRPVRWIEALSAESRDARVVTAAPNFAYEWAAQRGRPAVNSGVDLRDVVMIIGSEPVSVDAIRTFNAAFAPFGLPPTAIKPSYGIAEATLFVATTDPTAEATATHLDREQLCAGRAVRSQQGPDAVPLVSCGRVARSQWAVIVAPDSGDELPNGQVGEIWLQGANVGRGYWARPVDSQQTFGAVLRSVTDVGTHSAGAALDGTWLRTGDLGFYLDGGLFVTGRLADLITIDGRHHYPHDIENTVAAASSMVRRGYVAAFPAEGDETDGRVVIIAERAARTGRSDPAPAMDAIRDAVASRHGVTVSDVRIVRAGTIPRTTSGKLARWACREHYLQGKLAHSPCVHAVAN